MITRPIVLLWLLSLGPALTVRATDAHFRLRMSDFFSSENNLSPSASTEEESGPYGRIILDFTAKKKTWRCHWFPMQETRPGGDPINNLYAKNGALDKLDRVTGARARDYEFKRYRKGIDEGDAYGWWGHCDSSAEASCLLEEPRFDVVVNGKDGKPVKFSTIDIQGLIVKMMPNLIDRVDFRGNRFDDERWDDPNDPNPAVFISVLKSWARDGQPFVMDIDRKQKVWNFPYDRVRIYESLKAPDGFDKKNLPEDGLVKFYHIEMSGTGFYETKRLYQCFIQFALDGSVLRSEWIKTQKSHQNPDFLWRPHPVGDLMNRATWTSNKLKSNPRMDPGVVYDIYMKSIRASRL